MPRHIRKGDSVIVTKGASKGTIGEIIRVIDEGARVVVKGVNIRTMHIKPTQKVPQGSILKEEGPINASNVSPVVDGVRFVSKPDGSKSRIAARGGKELHQLRGPTKGGAAGASATSAAAKTTKPAAKKK
jgi:large subunit ribosomal protein L24